MLKFIRVYKYTLPHSIYIFYKLIKIYLVTKKKTTLDNTKSNQETRKEKLNKFKHKLVMREKTNPRDHTPTQMQTTGIQNNILYTNNMDTTYMKYSNKMKPSINVQAWKMLNSDNSFAYFSTSYFSTQRV